MAFYDQFFVAIRTLFDRSFEDLLRQRLTDATSFTIAEAPDLAFGRVIGIVRARGETIEAPLSARPCVAFRVIIDVAPGWLDTSPGRRTRRIGLYNRGSEFELVDGEHYAVVDSRVAIVITDSTHKEISQSGRTVTPRQQTILYETGLAHTRRPDGLTDFVSRNPGELRFSESIVAVGDTIAVLGGAIRESDPTLAPSSYRELFTRPRFAGTPKVPLVIGAPP